MMDFPETTDFYEWKQMIESNGVRESLMKQYYDSDLLYTVTIGDNEYSYPIGTHPQLLRPHFNSDHITKSDFETSDVNEEELSTVLDIIRNQINFNLSGELGTDISEDILWNENKYVVSGTVEETTDDSLTFELGLSDYYTSTFRSEKLSLEIIDAILEDHLIGSKTIVSEDVFKGDFPLRNKYFPSISERLKNCSTYRQGIGQTTLALLKKNEEYYILFAERSNNVHMWPGQNSVFPAGLLQPNNIASENILRDGLLEQFGKEFFDIDEPTLSSQPIGSLNQLIDSNDVDFTVTGAGLELVYGDFQVSSILVIEYKEYIEFIQNYHEESFEHTDIKLVKLSDLPEMIDSLASPTTITPTSQFALFNGLNYLSNEVDHISTPFDISVKQYQPHEPELL